MLKKKTELNNKTILVTGSPGFIGVNLVKKPSNNSIFGFESIIAKIYTYLKEECKIIFEIKDQYIKNNSLKVNMEELFSKLKDTFFFQSFKTL